MVDIKNGMPFSEEDLVEITKNEGTLYDWLDGNKAEVKREVSEKQAAPAGDYDTLAQSK